MKKEIEVIVIKRIDQEIITIELRTIEDKLEEYYALIGCRSIDIVSRYFNNIEFDVVCDDEGLLIANERGDWPTSWWQREGYTPNHEALCGVLVLTHHDTEGNLTSVDPMELIAVQNCYKAIPTKKGDILGLLFHDIERR